MYITTEQHVLNSVRRRRRRFVEVGQVRRTVHMFGVDIVFSRRNDAYVLFNDAKREINYIVRKNVERQFSFQLLQREIKFDFDFDYT